jgi:hypothetical protein
MYFDGLFTPLLILAVYGLRFEYIEAHRPSLLAAVTATKQCVEYLPF